MSQSFIFNVLCNLQVSDWRYQILRKCHFIYYIYLKQYWLYCQDHSGLIPLKQYWLYCQDHSGLIHLKQYWLYCQDHLGCKEQFSHYILLAVFDQSFSTKKIPVIDIVCIDVHCQCTNYKYLL